MSRAFDEADLFARLRARCDERRGELGCELHLFDEVTSTSDLAKAAAREGAPHGSLWIAERQTAGRGRQGRVWHSPPGEGLWMSVLLRVACAPQRLPPLSLVAGLAARDAIAPFVDPLPRVKWPNDVWIEGRKVCGCLVEAQVQGAKVDAVIVGIGINVHTRVFPEELALRATSVAIHARHAPHDAAPSAGDVDRVAILLGLLDALERDVPLVAARGLSPILPRLESADALRGQRVRDFSGAGEGTAEGIDEDGRLCVRSDDGTLSRWSAGEVHLAML